MSKGSIYKCKNCKQEFISTSLHHNKFCNRKCATTYHHAKTKERRLRLKHKEKDKEKCKNNYPEKLPPVDKNCRCGTKLDKNNYCVKCEKEYLPTQEEINIVCKELRKRGNLMPPTIPYNQNDNLRKYNVYMIRSSIVIKNE